MNKPIYLFPMTAEKLAAMPLQERLFFMDRLMDEGLDETFYAMTPDNQQKIWAHIIEKFDDDYIKNPLSRNQKKVRRLLITVFVWLIISVASKTIVDLTMDTTFLWWAALLIITIKLSSELIILCELCSLSTGYFIKTKQLIQSKRNNSC